MSAFSLPKRPRGRPTAAQNARFDLDLAAWCAAILEINSTLDFRVSSRGWCYILEEKGGLLKGDFDVAQTRINDCRKSGLLPLDICCDDEGRAPDGLEYLDVADVEQEVTNVLDYVANAHHHYNPISFWEAQPKYVEMATEKIDLKSLFSRECNPYHLLISNNSGWNDINSRAAMMRRFANWEAKGKQFVLIYCGDHDPGGLQISGFIHSNFNDLTGAVGWSPDNLIIERFGLDYDFIIAQGLTWIATVRAIERTLRSHGLDWHDIASALATSPSRVPREGASLWCYLDSEERLQCLAELASEPVLNHWSRSFVNSISAQIISGFRLSPKQLGCIDKIPAAAWRRGVRPDARRRA